MMNPNPMAHITRNELRDTYNLSEDEILEQFVPCLICNDEDCIDKNGTHITNNMVTGFVLPNLQTIN